MGLICNKAFELSLTYADLVIDDAELYVGMGYGKSCPNEDSLAIIEELKREASAICHPRVGYVIYEGEVADGRLRLSDRWFDPDAIISHCLKGASHYAVMVATVGREMDAWIHHYRADCDIMKAFVADTLGSVVAEAVVACGARQLEQVASSVGFSITNSYSPGYCGWHVSQQHPLFELLPSDFCGVKLCESGLMLPIKSVSTVIGMGADVVKKPYGCAICRKKDCYKRRLKTE